jgi:hypothetical protein
MGTMKKIGIALIVLALASCQASDQEIRADIAGKAQQDLNFSNLDYTVQAGVVNFQGRCPSEKALAKIKQTIANIHVIKAVHYQVTIAPVVLDTLTLVKLQADSLLAQYPAVTAQVYPAGITLKGNVTAVERAKLLQAFRRPHIGTVIDSLNVR